MSVTPARPSLMSDLLATAMVAAFSMVVALGYARVFSGWPFVVDLAIIVAVGHGSGLLLRRWRLTAWIAVPALALVLAWTVLAVYYSETFSWAMPTSDTWAVLGEQLDSVRGEFRTTVSPVDYGGGWDVLAAIGLAIAVLLADVFAFRADARAETLVPGGVLFVFVGALGDDRLRIASAVAVVGVGVAATATLRAYHAGPDSSRSTTSWHRWPVALGFAVVVALSAGFIGPRLPGADAAPLYETSGGSGGVSQVLSPLVDIRSRLTNRSTTELFRVRADAESYWRSSALPEFDGTTWGMPERDLQPIDGSLTAPPDSLIENRQQITIGALGGSLVPAAPDPFQASGPDDLRFAAETSTLVTVDSDLQAGDRIDIVSAAPVLSSAELSAATTAAAPDPIYTSVPVDLPPVVAATARQVTADATNSYDAALRLQTWFQNEFEYSLEVQPGHGNSAIESFLRDRVGYCEQFAGTFAAMLRTIGVPTRVAVGFTSGVPLADGEYSVLGRNAHAWPEVWFDDIGWVAFEPTPGRGAPNAESYTGIRPQQDTSATADEIDDADVAPVSTPAPGPIDGDATLNIPDLAEFPTDESSAPTALQSLLPARSGSFAVVGGLEPSMPNSRMRGTARRTPLRRWVCRCVRRTRQRRWQLVPRATSRW
jgi:transglutaminase-like putative cysteine protease